MDHSYIEELDLVHRYLMGRLTGDENAQFEEHFVDCAQCSEQLKTTKELIHGFRLMSSRQSADELDYDPSELPWYSLHGASTRWLALASGFLLLVLIAGGAAMFNSVRLSRIKVDEARSDSAQWQQRFEEERQSGASAERRHQETEQELTERLTQLQSGLKNMREPETARPHDGSLQPQINMPIFELKATRGGSQPDSINKFTLPRSATSFMVWLPLEGELGYRDYRMTILDDHGQLIWKSGGLKPDRNNSLSVLFNSSFLRPGTYTLTVEGTNEANVTSTVGKYRFRL